MLLKHCAKWIDGADKGRESAKMAALFDSAPSPIGHAQNLIQHFNKLLVRTAGLETSGRGSQGTEGT